MRLSFLAPLILFSLTHFPAFGQVRPIGPVIDVLPYSDKVQLAIRSEVEEVNKLNARVKAGDRSLCPSYHGTDMSGCATTLIALTSLHSAEGLREMLNLPVTAAMRDRESGLGEKRSSLLLTEGYLTVIENIHTQKFFAKTVRAKTAGDRTAKKATRSLQNQLLEKFKSQALPTVETHLAKTDALPANTDPSVQAWEKGKTQSLRARYAKLRTRRWAL